MTAGNAGNPNVGQPSSSSRDVSLYDCRHQTRARTLPAGSWASAALSKKTGGGDGPWPGRKHNRGCVLLNTDAISSGDDEDDTDGSEDFVSENSDNKSK